MNILKKDISSSDARIVFSSVVDEKGRIVIPASIRRSLGFDKGYNIELDLLLSERCIVIRGRSSLIGKTSDGGSDELGSRTDCDIRLPVDFPSYGPSGKNGKENKNIRQG